MARRSADGSTIGAVLARLRPDFPDVTISKIRFLEAEGLVSPARTQSGYRRFTEADVARLRFVLAAQRDHYLPLKVIREQLELLDRGEDIERLTAVARPTRGPSPVPAGITDAFADTPGPRPSRRDIVDAAGVSAELLADLEQYGLLRPGDDGRFDPDAVAIARTAAAMAEFGIEPRHLRSFRASADREVGLVGQVVAPLYRQRGPAARQRADATAREVAALSVELHARLVKAGLRDVTGG